MQFKYGFVDLIFLEKIAHSIAFNLRKGDTISLIGDLGVGKTTFVKFLVHSLSKFEDVSSPTFNIVHQYYSEKFIIYHVDLYRINHLYEIYDLGLESICNDGVGIIEWPDLLDGILDFNLKINMKYSTMENMRDVEIFANDNRWYNVFKLFCM